MHSRIFAGALVCAVGMGMAGTASAAAKWANTSGGNASVDQGVEYSVADFGLFQNPNDNTIVVLQVRLKPGQLVSGTGCAVSNNSAADGSAQFANWNTSITPSIQQQLIILNTAAATGGTIKIQYSDANCSNAFGAFIQGLRYIPPAN